MYYKTELLEILLKIKQQVPKECKGICDNVDLFYPNELTDQLAADWLATKFCEWPLFSGDIDFPVPSLDSCSADTMYLVTENYWTGDYGELRYELLDFLIQELTKELSEC